MGIISNILRSSKHCKGVGRFLYHNIVIILPLSSLSSRLELGAGYARMHDRADASPLHYGQ